MSLIEGVRILRGQDPERERISEDEARRVAAERAREQALTIRQGGDRRSEEARIKRDDIAPDPVERGTSSAYLLRRLARTSPDTLAAFEAGEFPSIVSHGVV